MGLKWTSSLLLSAALMFVGSIEVPKTANFAGLGGLFGVDVAAAQHGQTRRVARRTSRRTARRHSVAGCSPYRTYYNCGGVYYAPVVESGTTVYVVVNP